MVGTRGDDGFWGEGGVVGDDLKGGVSSAGSCDAGFAGGTGWERKLAIAMWFLLRKVICIWEGDLWYVWMTRF